LHCILVLLTCGLLRLVYRSRLPGQVKLLCALTLLLTLLLAYMGPHVIHTTAARFLLHAFLEFEGKALAPFLHCKKDHKFLLHVPRPRPQLSPTISPAQPPSASSSMFPVLKKGPTTPLVRADRNPKCPQSDGEKL
jgi:hypothetical protein